MIKKLTHWFDSLKFNVKLGIAINVPNLQTGNF